MEFFVYHCKVCGGEEQDNPVELAAHSSEIEKEMLGLHAITWYLDRESCKTTQVLYV